MNITIKPIGVIRTPFCNLENMPVQPCGAKNIYATIKLKKRFAKGL